MNRGCVDVQQVRAFLAVAELRHFGHAAARLHLAQPHVSRVIRSLETELGAPLFTRSTRRVALTTAGEALIEPATRLLGAHDDARRLVTAAHEGRSGRVRIGFAGPSAHVSVGRLARAVRERHPSIDLEFSPGRYGTAALTAVLEGDVDLALARLAEPPAGVASRVVSLDELVVVAPTDHRLAAQDRLRVDDLRDEPLVLFPASFGSAVHELIVARCRAAGFAPRFAPTAPDTWTGVALAAAGVGLHVTTRSAVEHLPREGIRVVGVNDALPPISVYLLWRRDDDDPALARVLATSREVVPGPASP